MQVGGLSKELGRLFRRVLTPRLVPPALRDSLQLATVRGGGSCTACLGLGPTLILTLTLTLTLTVTRCAV